MLGLDIPKAGRPGVETNSSFADSAGGFGLAGSRAGGTTGAGAGGAAVGGIEGVGWAAAGALWGT